MKIVHLCVSCFYIDGYAYQENELVAQHVRDGHDVTVIASTESFGDNREVVYLQPRSYMGTDGAMVIRLPYRNILPGMPAFVSRKLRMHPGVYDLLVSKSPDVIFFHGMSGWEILNAVKYRKKHPKTRLFVDCHEDLNNSARGFLSKHILHSLYYKSIFSRCTPFIEKVLCVSLSTVEFAKDFYEVPPSLIEFYPLGGEVFSDEEYSETRIAKRAEYGVAPETLMFVQSGKMDKKKKLVDALKSFSRQRELDAVYCLIGHVFPEIEAEVQLLIQADPRIVALGWKSPEELRDLLCAADVYVQPGSQSATMQMSICARCAVVLDDVPSHEPYIDGNGWLVGRKITLDDAFEAIDHSQSEISLMCNQSAAIASRLLDYRSLAARVY